MVRKLSKSDVVVLWYGIGLLQSHWSENSKDHGNSLKKPSDPFFFFKSNQKDSGYSEGVILMRYRLTVNVLIHYI